MVSIIEQRVEKLKVQTDKLKQLLDDAHPGLLTWLELVPKYVKELQSILDGERDE